MIKIMLVDDHMLFRKGLRSLLEVRPGFTVVAETGDGESAAELYERHLPDVVLMDVQLPGLDGIHATRLIVQAHPDAHVIILSATDFDDQVQRGIQAGAIGYLAKNLDPEELFRTIELAASGQACLSRERLEQVMGARTRVPAGTTGQLSQRENQVLSLVARGCTNREIADELCISLNTVKTHVSNIMDKLGVRNRVELAAYEFSEVR